MLLLGDVELVEDRRKSSGDDVEVLFFGFLGGFERRKKVRVFPLCFSFLSLAFSAFIWRGGDLFCARIRKAGSQLSMFPRSRKGTKKKINLLSSFLSPRSFVLSLSLSLSIFSSSFLSFSLYFPLFLSLFLSKKRETERERER